ncbi:MAG: histidine kinase [Bacteroidales bacterium]|nr:histidine kinase [Bacteroidales bacterium]
MIYSRLTILLVIFWLLPQTVLPQNDVSAVVYYKKLSLDFQNQSKLIESIQNEMLALKAANELERGPLRSYCLAVRKLLPLANDSLNRTRLYYRFGLLLENQGELKRAAVFIEEALRWAEMIGNDKALAVIANELAGIYSDLGRWQLSTETYNKMLIAAKNLLDSNLMAAAYLNMGDNYKELGDYDRGGEQMIQALRLKESNADSSHLSYYYLKAAELAKISQNHNQWINYIHKAYRLKDDTICTTNQEKAMIYSNLGSIAEYNNDLNSALKYYDTLMTLSQQISYVSGIRGSLANRAGIYKKQGEIQKALRLLLDADQYPTQNPYYDIRSNKQKAELYLMLGKPNQALKLLNKNIQSGLLSNYAAEKLRTFELIYKADVSLGHYRSALIWNDSLRALENNLRDKDVAAKLAELDKKYQTEKKEQKIQLLEAEHKIYDQQIRMGIFFIAGLIVVILLGIYMQRLNKLKSEYRESLLQQQLLRAQMNPHFIFNALASIQNFMLKNQSEKAAHFLGKFASVARLVLVYSAEEKIPLTKELEILRNYIEIEKMRARDVFTYTINVSGEMETDFINIPPMALQPFVENAIKHGLKEQEGGFLFLSFRELKNNIMEVVIEDNGQGIDHTQNENREHHRSMAMEIFSKRRKLWQKRSKKELNLIIKDLSEEGRKGTRVVVQLPVLS